MRPGVCCLQVKETTRAVTFLHNELFFAAAQKKYVYIYDKRGLEVHCLREHVEPAALEFLPHHFLLASVGEPGKPCLCSCHHVLLETSQSTLAACIVLWTCRWFGTGCRQSHLLVALCADC
jgi:U3 small nucleolar RNA-associated protein 7